MKKSIGILALTAMFTLTGILPFASIQSLFAALVETPPTVTHIASAPINTNKAVVKNVGPTEVSSSTIIDPTSDAYWIKYELLATVNVKEFAQKAIAEGKKVYFYGKQTPSQPELFKSLGLTPDIRWESGNPENFTNTIIGVQAFDYKNNKFYIDELSQNNPDDNNEILDSLVRMSKKTLDSEGVPAHLKAKNHTVVEAAGESSSWSTKTTYTKSWSHATYGRIDRTEQVVVDTGESDSTKDYFALHHWVEHSSGDYLWNNGWEAGRIYFREDPNEGNGTTFLTYSPTASTGNPTSVSLGIAPALNWTFDGNAYDIEIIEGSTGLGYIRWMLDEVWYAFWLPEHLVFQPGSKHYTPQGGYFNIRSSSSAYYTTNGSTLYGPENYGYIDVYVKK